MKRRNGFTLLELLVVIALITILMLMLLPAVLKLKDKGKAKRAEVQAHIIEAAIEAYKLQYHKWPAPPGDLGGPDQTYGAGGNDNSQVMTLLDDPPGNDPPLLDLDDFRRDGDNVLNPWKKQFQITLDLNRDYLPSGGVAVKWDAGR